MPNAIPQLLSVQYLRAAAALLVVLFHSGGHLARLELPGLEMGWMASGVDVFFVISGLIMWTVTALRPVPPGVFLYRRAVRIVPLYWILTSAMVAATLLVPGLLRTAGLDGPHILASYLFIPYPHPRLPDAMPILVPGWTLNLEMFFYLLFAAGLALRPGLRFWAMGAALAAFDLAAALSPRPGTLLGFYGASIVLEFWFGMALGRALLSGRLPGAAASVALLLAGALALPFAWGLAAEWPRGLVVGLPAAAVVAGALGLEQAGWVRRWRFPLAVGDASYGLYLSHVIVLAAVAAFWKRIWPMGGPVSTALYLLLACAVSVAVALVLYRVVEVPLARAMRSRAAATAQARAV